MLTSDGGDGDTFPLERCRDDTVTVDKLAAVSAVVDRSAPAGRASRLQYRVGDAVLSSELCDRLCSSNERLRDVLAFVGDDACGTSQYVVAVAASEFRRRPRCGEPAELFRARGKRAAFSNGLHYGRVRSRTAVIPARNTREAGTDQHQFTLHTS